MLGCHRRADGGGAGHHPRRIWPRSPGRWSAGRSPGRFRTRTSTWPSSGGSPSWSGPVGGKVHTGRSRNDQVALDLQLYLRNAVSGHQARVAAAHGGSARPGREARRRHLPGLHASAAGATGRGRPPSARLLLRPAARLGAARRLARDLVDAARRRGAGRRQLPPRPGHGGGGARASPTVAPNAMDAVAARDTAFAYLAHRGELRADALAAGGGAGALEHPGVRAGRAARVVDVGVEHHAAEAQPGRRRAGAGQRRRASWPGCRGWACC